MTDSVQAQLEAVLRGIEERVDHKDECSAPRWSGRHRKWACDCDRPARVRAEQARAVERMVNKAIGAAAQTPPALLSVAEGEAKFSAGWAAALRAGEGET